jgi:hypothetical protein
VALLLGFCWYALFATQRSEGSPADLNELLLTELTADEPRLLPGSHHWPALTDKSQSHQSPGD